ncbi:MAG: hypothetical protein AAF490_00520 [Chloroflexota bacterium]
MQTIDQIQQKFQNQIHAFRAAGDIPKVVELHGRLGLILFQHERWKQSAKQYDQAAQLALAANETAVSAHLYYAQGIALQELPRKQKAAQQAFKQSVLLYEQSSNPSGVEKARQALTVLKLQAQDIDGALTAVGELKNLPPDQQIIRLRRRAAIYLMAEQPEQAASLLQKAAEIAIDQPALLLEIELELQVIATPSPQSSDLFADLLSRALNLGNFELVASIQLEQAAEAFMQRAWQTAVSHAEAARQASLQSTEINRYITYLIAYIISALAREQQQDDVGVLDVLLTCKGTLSRHLTPQIGQQFNLILDSLLPRWGEARFQEALRLYREQGAGIGKR